MKRALLSMVVAGLLISATPVPARANWGAALGGFVAGTFFGAAIAHPPVVYAAPPVYAVPPVYAAPAYPPPVVYPPVAYIPGRYVVRYDTWGRPCRVWVGPHRGYARY